MGRLIQRLFMTLISRDFLLMKLASNFQEKLTNLKLEWVCL
ncbi:hypothetical protein CXB51_014021 [Gossypium anomalum]|uniref:Uncharacterized protein n=1 Tax=Gossypium anomalum TaxID=47600 RepID=A0A8J5Z275_9ROSI|nr:hypothetical protein CXB51_014021 [Gossypium anomalum]